MYRVILCAVAALLIATAVQPAKTDDKSACNTGHDADEVIAACSRRLTLYPRDAVVYGNRGSAYTVKGDYDRAIADRNRRSGSIRNCLTPTTSSATSITRRAITTARLPNTTKRSGSIRSLPIRAHGCQCSTPIAAALTWTKAIPAALFLILIRQLA